DRAPGPGGLPAEAGGDHRDPRPPAPHLPQDRRLRSLRPGRVLLGEDRPGRRAEAGRRGLKRSARSLAARALRAQDKPTGGIPMDSPGNPRVLNVWFGVWLFVSAFLWAHSPAQMNNAWVSGALCVVFALLSLASPPVRYLNTLLSIWLFISAFALERDR